MITTTEENAVTEETREVRSTIENAVTEKTRDLCRTILAQPNMGDIRQRIDAFMADDKSRAQYETLMTKGQALNDKQVGSSSWTVTDAGPTEVTTREPLIPAQRTRSIAHDAHIHAVEPLAADEGREMRP